MKYNSPYLGFGLGLRGPFAREVEREQVACDFFEIISENFMGCRGVRMERLEAIADRYPIVLHGVSLSIGSSDELDQSYLRLLRELADRVSARLVSDHLCWTGVGGENSHDLLPVVLDEGSLHHIVERIKRVSDALDRPIYLENPTTYVAFAQSTIPEAEFLMRLCESAPCGLLLDINNVLVNATNLGFCPWQYLDTIDPKYVAQIHLAGHAAVDGHLVDTHDAPVPEKVWQLYEYFIRRAGLKSTLIERDADIPPLSELLSEIRVAEARARGALYAHSA
jgi:hypothetical protein